MKKELIIGIILSVILVILIIFINPLKEGLSEEKILESIKSEVNDYCERIEEKAFVSHCATCKIEEYKLVKNFSKTANFMVEYMINKEDKNYVIDMKIGVIFGWNTRNGMLEASIILDEEGNVIERNFVENTCDLV
ncbi:MAG: hypothetical protein Q8P15_02140 [Nanoarchaeota archaeon]|nr:hypothetical protein [Nanoarchaeota archaeon]